MTLNGKDKSVIFTTTKMKANEQRITFHTGFQVSVEIFLHWSRFLLVKHIHRPPSFEFIVKFKILLCGTTINKNNKDFNTCYNILKNYTSRIVPEVVSDVCKLEN